MVELLDGKHLSWMAVPGLNLSLERCSHLARKHLSGLALSAGWWQKLLVSQLQLQLGMLLVAVPAKHCLNLLLPVPASGRKNLQPLLIASISMKYERKIDNSIQFQIFSIYSQDDATYSEINHNFIAHTNAYNTYI